LQASEIITISTARPSNQWGPAILPEGPKGAYFQSKVLIYKIMASTTRLPVMLVRKVSVLLKQKGTIFQNSNAVIFLRM